MEAVKAMPEIWRSVVSRLKEFWGLGRTGTIIILLMLVAVLVAAILVFSVMSDMVHVTGGKLAAFL